MDGEKRALASELEQVLTMVRQLEARMDHDLPDAARELCGELASSVDRSIRIARSWGPGASPGSRAASPRSDAANASAQSPSFKRRKGMPCVRMQVRTPSVQDMAPLDDGLSWRKYGQKDILDAKYPRAYFRCTHRNTQDCQATKHVQRADADPLLYDVVYHGAHTCAQAAHPAAERLRHQLLLQQAQAGDADDAAPTHALADHGSSSGLQAPAPEPMTPLAGADFAAGFPLLPSPTGLEYQFRYAAGGYGFDAEFQHQYEELFTNPAEPFQWEYQDLYAAN